MPKWIIDYKFSDEQLSEHLKYCRPLYLKWAKARRDIWLKPNTETIDKYEESRKMTSALGGRVGNNAMQMLREISIRELHAITAIRDADMTPTLARNILREVLGRSVDDDILIANFATEGRTAANKTTWKVDDFETEIETLMEHILALKVTMKKDRDRIREFYKRQYTP
jgi:hypothetical protein